MEEISKNKAIKTIIIVLSVLLCVSSVALAAVLLYDRFAIPEPSSVVAPDNIITPDDALAADPNDPLASQTGSSYQRLLAGSRGSKAITVSIPYVDDDEITISLSKRNPDENIPFNVINMFPGDVETKYYNVKVSYKDTVNVKYRADVRDGYEKLAEVLMCKITLLSSDEVLYEGLMRDMPESLDHVLTSEENTEEELRYEIIAYLDTSVGNEYQRQQLVADFYWWLEFDDEGDDPTPPFTGDPTLVPIAIGLIAAAALIFLIVFIKRRKEKKDDEC